MITVKKLSTLKERTRLRKISMILHEAAVACKNNQPVDMDYIEEVLSLISVSLSEPRQPRQPRRTREPRQPRRTREPEELAFFLEDQSQALLAKLGAEPSDWDFTDQSGALDETQRIVQDKVLVLDRIRSPYNVGAIFRSAEAFGVSKIILVEGTASPEHVRALRTSRGTTAVIPWSFMSEKDVVSFLETYDPQNVIALELGGISINEFSFPSSGVAVLGSEEFGISPVVLSCCKSRVSIPMGGAKGSLNVSVAAGILLQRWF
ncbi:MAG: TrmH family RNA methyltransferase [Spirochaetales bacterium]|nr:TrmH family RNA methyltransferase [Spirochaetales bacterium]MBO6049660.1 TrmH family RNA methyltransferase [Spirochaetales bacterium]